MVKRKEQEVFRDEEKKAKTDSGKQDQLISDMEKVLNLILRKPSCLQSYKMANISSMLRKISLNPMLFPPPAGEEISPTSFPLTKNIGVPLYEREDVVYKDFVVQVTAASFDKGNTKILKTLLRLIPRN
mmetsp:Transcript_6814/g.12151  ORF Transcript_6814/g.12151 Transcript_6814/m.12151 type:complete len:129 (-) Transcript_6814:65-451(-)